ncbi:MAG: septal ring lytic transglycosylase RlpA family protein [Pseudomonadota bacterium]
MRSNNRGMLPVLAGAMTLLVSCSGGEQPGVPPAPAPISRPVAQRGMVADDPVKIGAPYKVGGTTYTPEDAPSYDVVGYAGWYGEELAGGDTANGEAFVPSAITAAHRTLPLPSYVEVTALDTGRTIVVRVNDRGPFANSHIIDLSRGAAEQLGLIGAGAAPVRVRRVSPPDQERVALRSHGRVAERLETPPALLKALREKLPRKPAFTAAAPAPATKAVPKPMLRETSPPLAGSAPVPMAKSYVVQVAAFSSRARAQTLATRIGAQAVEGAGLWRVRFGPYPTQDAAQAGVRAAASGGFENARIMANDAP